MRMKMGNVVGEVARSLFPSGVLIDTTDLPKALKDTKKALKKNQPIYEATFQYKGVLVRVDVLLPNYDGSWDIIEVKSAKEMHQYYYEDAAVQTWVVKNCGLPIQRTILAHVDGDFVYPGNKDYTGLLHHNDVTENSKVFGLSVPEWVDEALLTINTKEEPEVFCGKQCKKPFPCSFKKYCSSKEDKGIEYPVETLPGIAGKNHARKLKEMGYTDLLDVPDSLLVHKDPYVTALWGVIKEASTTNKQILNRNVKDTLNAFGYPQYHLDFETIAPALPVFEGTRPYQYIPFQWSCHIDKGPRSTIHREFLSDGKSDPRRKFAESLIEVCGDKGVIFVWYIPFERGRVEELIALFPDLMKPLEAIKMRMVDLLEVTKSHYYHPAQKGSWSIKKVLPTIAPDLDYSNLEVTNGSAAMDAFHTLLTHAENGEDDKVEELMGYLLKYCKRDTNAMVRIVRFLRSGRRRKVCC